MLNNIPALHYTRIMFMLFHFVLEFIQKTVLSAANFYKVCVKVSVILKLCNSLLYGIIYFQLLISHNLIIWAYFTSCCFHNILLFENESNTVFWNDNWYYFWVKLVDGNGFATNQLYDACSAMQSMIRINQERCTVPLEYNKLSGRNNH